MKTHLKTLLAVAAICSCGSATFAQFLPEETPEGWFAQGQRALEEAKELRSNNKPAKNIILFLGDGMGVTTVTAARILDGQLRGESGEENSLSFEKLPYSAFSKTYSVNQQTADSAPTITAIVTGVKTKDAMLSVSQRAVRGDYASVAGNELPTILEIMKRAGRSVGVVTTTRLTHATPAACYAHVPERDWEGDADLSGAARAAGFPDIARQLVEFAPGIDVAFGGGRGKFVGNNVRDPKGGKKGTRLDGRNLTEEWKAKQGLYIFTGTQLRELSPQTTNRVLGLFNYSHLEFEHDRIAQDADEPSLTEMTVKAIELLARNTNGFFLMVEGGRIDHGHHMGNAFRALTETVEFSRAVAAALKKVSLDDTLVVVTADHSHTLTLGGYPKRGNSILGVVKGTEEAHSKLEKMVDGLGLTYTTLNYANGPGFIGASDVQPRGVKTFPHEPEEFSTDPAGRPDLSRIDTAHPDFLQEANSPREMETHGGEDVPVFAGGPKAHLLHGVVEQNFIFHLMLEASGIPVSVRQENLSAIKVVQPQGN